MSFEEQPANIEILARRVRRAFEAEYGQPPSLLVAAPGRVNLIGEHTDYNDGFVLPAAIDRHVVIAARPRDDNQVRIHAVDFGRSASFSLEDIRYDERERWSNYERGVAWALLSEGYTLGGMDAAIISSVPIASGLSSSAAIEVATAFAFQLLGDLDLDGVRRALLCQKAENEFVGMQCGIMDQYIVSLGKRDHALLIDCRSLDCELVPLPAGCSVVICNTKKRRGLVDSEYNTRRQECEKGARILGVRALRDVTPEMFSRRAGELDEVTRKRCRHVVTENQRTLDAVQALREGDIRRFGQLMNASHISLRDDYEVSCFELDAMVEAAWKQDGVIGARMTGAGFGGCTVNLVREEAVSSFVENVGWEYEKVTGFTPEIYVCQAEEGVHRIK